MPTITNIIPNVNNSLFYWLNTITYTKNSITGKISSHFPGINILLGFPSALEALKLPSISLVENSILPQSNEVFGEYRKMITFPFTIWGFAGSKDDDGKNKYERDTLKNDLRFLLEKTYFINIYDFPESLEPDFNTVSTDVEIMNIKTYNIPITGTNKVDRYRFAVDFDLLYYWNIDLT